MTERFRVAIVGSGPGGLSAAAHAAALGVPHVLLEAAPQLSNTIFRYQRGKFVMAEPGVLPLRSNLGFEAGSRESILERWDTGAEELKLNVRYRAEVTAIRGERGGFEIETSAGERVEAEYVVLGIGLQGNLRKLAIPGADAPIVQYQLDDPDEYADERIVVIGAGDAAIENALALTARNQVTQLNRRDGFDRAKDGNQSAVLKAIENGTLGCIYNANPERLEQTDDGYVLVVASDDGDQRLPVDRIIARLGATPPRRFVEACGIAFPSDDPAAVPEVSETYESNVPGLHIVGALAGYPLIKQAMNQGYEVVEYIEGRRPEPADAPLLKAKFDGVPGWEDVDTALTQIRESVPVLAPLTNLQLREFLLDSTVHQPAPGEVVFLKNDYTDTFYSVVRGGVEIEVGDDGSRIPVAQGQFFGEMGLISGRRRAATVYAGDGCVLIETPRRSMRKLINSVEAVRRVIDQTFLKRAIRSQLAPEADEASLDALAESAELRSYKRGEVLFREGDAGEDLFLIRTGSVTVSRTIGDKPVVLAYVPAGQYVGEMALVSDAPRSATVEAAVAVEAITLAADPFRRLMADNPAVRERVDRVYKRRLSSNAAARSSDGDNSVLAFLMEQGLGEATDVLVINESLCVGCDQCERACAATHGEVGRLNRKAGASFANLHVPTSCRHCEHPHCMKDCPPDAIRRAATGEVYITDACIGCGNCERNCPYGVIQMGVPQESSSLLGWLMLGLGDEPGRAPKKTGKNLQKKAAKCDMCRDLPGGPACVRACPTGAAQRASPEQFIRVYRNG